MQFKRSYCHVRGPQVAPDIVGNPLWNAEKSPDYLIHTERRSIGTISHLILFLYDREGEIRYIVFQTKGYYNTLVYTSSGRKWRTARLASMIKNCTERCRPASAEDDMRMTLFCENGKAGIDAVIYLQQWIYYVEHLPTAREMFKNELPLPADWEEFVFAHLPHYIFYDASQKGKCITGYCTCCQSEVSIRRHKYNEEGVCPECGASIHYRSDGRRGDIVDRMTVQVMNRIGDDLLLLRFFKVYSAYSKDSRNLSMYIYEPARKLFYWNDNNEFGWQGYYRPFIEGQLREWRQGYFPRAHYQITFNGDEEGALYHDNLEEVLKDTVFEHSALGLFAKGNPKGFCVTDYFYSYSKAPVLEQILKGGYSKLASGIAHEVLFHRGTSGILDVNIAGTNIKDILGVDKETCRLLQRQNPSLSMLGKVKELLHHDVRISDELYSYIQVSGIRDMQGLAEVLSYITLNKLKFYVDQQHARGELSKIGYGQTYTMYKDYLHAANALGYDMKNSFVLFPKHLKAAHDEATALYAKKIDLEECQMFIDINKKYQERYGYDNGIYIMKAPENRAEMIAEGQRLHNCVATYTKDVVRGNKMVLFVRRKDSPDQPYCCIEVQNGRIVQSEMAFHENPNEQVKRFLEDWKREKLHSELLAA